MAIKHTKRPRILVRKEQKTKIPYVRIFGKLIPIKESELPMYKGFHIEYL